MPYRLVHDEIPRDLFEAGEAIQEMIRSGEATGLMFGVTLKRRRYLVNVAGEVARDPTFARGMCAALDDELREMVQGRAASATTL